MAAAEVFLLMITPMLAAMLVTGWVLHGKCLGGPRNFLLREPADSPHALWRRYPAAALATLAATLCAGATWTWG